jgi:uncharacterized pyridoxamine 5'-phosphate oxidase family protein
MKIKNTNAQQKISLEVFEAGIGAKKVYVCTENDRKFLDRIKEVGHKLSCMNKEESAIILEFKDSMLVLNNKQFPYINLIALVKDENN